MSLLVSSYCICACLHRCPILKSFMCCLSPFHLTYVAVSRPRRLSEYYCALAGPHSGKVTTVEPDIINDPRYNDVPGITMNILCGGKSYSKMYAGVRTSI